MPIKIHVPDVEFFNGETSQFFVVKGGDFFFEHSLLSLAQWEAKYRKPLLDRKEHTVEEFADYALMMELSGTMDPRLVTIDLVNQISEYIVDNPTATKIKRMAQTHQSSSFVTSETIYASMAMAQVPYSAETWNLNRLLNVLEIIGERSNPDKKKKSRNQVASEYRALNQKRRAEMRSRG